MQKIFHLTAKSLDLPEIFKNNLEQIRLLYPDWEVMVHTDEDIELFVREHFLEYCEHTFNKMPMKIMQVDTVRYMWMYIYGGVYCDFDIHFYRPIEFPCQPTFIHRDWTYPEDNAIKQSIHNCIFSSPKGHPLWLDFLEGISKNVTTLSTTKWGKLLKKQPRVFDVTGPNAISRIISDKKVSGKYNDIKILPGKTLFQQGKSTTPLDDASVEHQVAGSWR
ncbi:MAG: mannosyltransferase OCH1-like enzyme [Lentisphaeria bacterium]|jgi:mannosyltransferase OCH1-like enzyme